jgi:undecaprenol kinase/diacylglycerol kinase (ATP)
MLWKERIQSLRHAIAGVRTAWLEENNFKIAVVCGIAAIILGILLQISMGEFFFVITLIGFVLSTEALNTALEEFCDMVKSNPDPHIAKIKDLAAAAVLIASTTALVIGVVIFIPHLIAL